MEAGLIVELQEQEMDLKEFGIINYFFLMMENKENVYHFPNPVVDDEE